MVYLHISNKSGIFAYTKVVRLIKSGAYLTS
nr:MAG TPA: hypothetical protein [Caudoviricetes sp.]